MIYIIMTWQLMFFSDTYSVTMTEEFGTLTSCMEQGNKSVKGTDLAFECRLNETTMYPNGTL